MTYSMAVAWKPGQRTAQRSLEDPYEDVPLHLRQPLWNWIQGCFERDHERLQQLAIDLRMHLPVGRFNEQVDFFLQHSNEDEEFMLDLVEAILYRYRWDDQRAMGLANLLQEANSAYVVKKAWDGLEERVTPGVKELVREAVDAAGGSAGDHLATAWNAAYGRSSDPVKAYSEAIKAVEAALAPHISPQNGKQTLGTMIRDISAKPSKWTFEIPPGNGGAVEAILSVMKTLWEGQSSRHGGLQTTRSESLTEARAALHFAAALVQFGVTGAFRKA